LILFAVVHGIWYVDAYAWSCVFDIVCLNWYVDAQANVKRTFGETLDRASKTDRIRSVSSLLRRFNNLFGMPGRIKVVGCSQIIMLLHEGRPSCFTCCSQHPICRQQGWWGFIDTARRLWDGWEG
jgi:hypothetical protein